MNILRHYYGTPPAFCPAHEKQGVTPELGQCDPAQTPMNKKPVAPGFTLAECLVVLAIVAILTGLCATALSRHIPSAHLSHASRAIVSLCRQGRLEAIRANAHIRLVCDSTANICRLSRGDNGALLNEVNFTAMGQGITVTRPCNVTFSATGRVAPAGTVTVRNGAGESRSATIRTSGGVVTK